MDELSIYSAIKMRKYENSQWWRWILDTLGVYLFSDCISVYMSEYDMSCVSIDTVYRVAKDLYVVFNGDTGY